jgi:hypothetical protein
MQTFTEYCADWEFPTDLKEHLDWEVAFWGGDFINLPTTVTKVLSRNDGLPFLSKYDQDVLIERLCKMCLSMLVCGVPRDAEAMTIAKLHELSAYRALCQTWMERLAEYAAETWLEFTDGLVLDTWDVWDGSADGPMPAAVLSRDSNGARIITAVTKELRKACSDLCDKYWAQTLPPSKAADGEAPARTPKVVGITDAKHGWLTHLYKPGT